MKNVSFALMALLIGGVLLAACGQTALPTAAPEVKPPSAKVAAPASKADWEQKWEAVLTEAKKERSLSVSTIYGAEVRAALSQAFNAKYGIELEVSPFVRGAELIAKFQAERRAGLPGASVFIVGNTTLSVSMKPLGILTPIEPLLILPEVLDAKAWRIGRIPFSDEEGLVLGMIGQVPPTVVYNSELIKEGAITSVRDLLKPEYKGKIIIDDPSVSGAGNAVFAHLANIHLGREETAAFLGRLIKDQAAVIERDRRIPVEATARGKYLIVLGPGPDATAEFLAAGAPIKVARVREGDRTTPGSGALGVPAGFYPSNATRVFLNWLLSRDGQSVLAEAAKQPSMRLDASTKGINPLFIPAPGEKYHLQTEQHLAAADWVLEMAQKTIQAGR
ncbi:MAG: extracellular solute-binding protein [Chloroflexi bacterium]|nr:extracellular solute-binding protein [Chloroflexota bacterium]